MKKQGIACLMMWLIALTAFGQRRECIDNDWAFWLGKLKGAETAGYADNGWRRLDLPHDWSVETDAALMHTEHVGPFAKDAIGTHQTGHTIGGEGWYRRHITLTAEELKGVVTLYFEGVYNQSRVYVNGKLSGFNPYGYQSFHYDITKLCHDGDNVIAVQAVNEGNNTRWYAGSGIFRHVWLVKTPATHLVEWDTYVTSSPSHPSQVTLHTGFAGKTKGCTLDVEILDPQGKSVAHESGAPKTETQIEIASPQLWSTDTPNLYTARLTLTTKDGQKDEIVQHFGMRTIEVSAEKGFLLNGQPLLLKGGCVHHDHGLLGAASHDDAERRKIRLLKEQGYNAVRCSHNLPSEAFLDECDRQGMVVIDECFDQWTKPDGKNQDDYHIYFKEWHERDLSTMIRRDRRHPSVCFWSLGNEIPERAEEVGVAIAKRLREIVLSLDSTRPITAAIATWGNGRNNWEEDVQPAFAHLDAGGYNYNWQRYKSDHERFPQRVMMGTESFPKQAAENWQMVESESYVIGDFVWTAMDYLGEAGIGHVVRAEDENPFFMPWPWYNGWCGDIDLIGQKKPQSYYRDVVWGRRPIAMGVELQREKPDQISLWGWQDEQNTWMFPTLRRHTPMLVNVYTRAPQAKLFLNNQLIGTRTVGKTYCATFPVPYVSGTLRAVEWDGEQEGAEVVFRTGTDAIGMNLVTDVPSRDTVTTTGNATAGRNRLVYITAEMTDASGIVVNDSETKVDIRVQGNGTLMAAGNASPTDMESFRSATPRLFQGRAMAIVKTGDKAGKLSVTFSAPGVLPHTATINVE